ncbi:MAG: rRNA maturation RNase YbeY [Acidimicrobiaceae bacterium]|nr:rRNA maturation RNase YbeY [Acidimicrobiaceae bacterium]MCY4176559.1 rRNA maturation RNase YbeY [Acidimicrobiaceae bacterium]MCY4294703.1 rRNA maturation RNase YbeY [Acidimicrobiaceae bacterium]
MDPDPGNGPLAAGPEVVAADETSPTAGSDRIDAARWARLAADVLRAEGCHCGELGLRFVGLGAMAELNSLHMGESGPTDVLAFPIDARPREAEPALPADAHAGHAEPTVLLGDVVICPAYAARARRQDPVRVPARNGDGAVGGDGGSCGPDSGLDDELALLVVHGVLHVLGYDHAHPGEAALMAAQQRRLLAAHHRRDTAAVCGASSRDD